jgi:hypothetical protein
MVFICKRCNQEFLHKFYLKSHLERKRICEFVDNDYNVKILLEELCKRNLKDKTYDCEYCGMKFNSTSGKCQHKKICKSKPKETGVLVNELSEQVKKLQLKVDELQLPSGNNRENEKFNQLLSGNNRKNEKFFQLLLEKYLNGTHKTLSCGITDVTTKSCHAEIKKWSSWKEAIGQLTSYNVIDPKERLEMYMFGKYTQKCKNEAIKVVKICKINIFEFVEKEDGTISIFCLTKNEDIFNYKLE